MKKPGSQAEAGSFLGFESSFKGTGVSGYPGGPFNPLGLGCVRGRRVALAAAHPAAADARVARLAGARPQPAALGLRPPRTRTDLYPRPARPRPRPRAPCSTSSKESMDDFKWREIRNGRLAMVAFLGFAAQYGATGKGPIDNLTEHLADPWGESRGAGRRRAERRRASAPSWRPWPRPAHVPNRLPDLRPLPATTGRRERVQQRRVRAHQRVLSGAPAWSA